jgi:serine/threonine protein kinase
LKLLNNHAVQVSDDIILALKVLSLNKLIILRQLTEKLIKYHRLSETTLTEILNEIMEMPQCNDIEIYHAKKEKKDGVSITELVGIMSLFTKRGASKEEVLKGQYGFVKRGYEAADSQEPRWAIKSFSINHCFFGSNQEAISNKILGRTVILYSTNNKNKLGYTWQDGVTLYSLKESNKLSEYSFKDRLKWYVSLLNELYQLHHARIAHHDIHSRNIIVDPKRNTASLIDLGLSYLVTVGNDGFRVDIYRMKGVAKNFFEKELTEKGTIYHSAIKYLSRGIDNEPLSSKSCSAKQALDYCQYVLDNLDNINEEILKNISCATINRSEFTGCDVYYETERALMMAS